MKNILLIIIVLFASGCATDKGLVRLEQLNAKDLEVQQVENVSKKIVILRDGPTRASVLPVLTDWFHENGFEVTVIELLNDAELNNYIFTYRAWWSWDMALYMRKADMNVMLNGKTVGTLSFDALQYGGFGKFGSGEKRLRILLDALFGKITREQADKLLGEA